jgi:hypothetical protein
MALAYPKFFVYGLRDPRTFEIKYVGLSTVGIERPRQHAAKSSIEKHPNTPKSKWLSELRSAGIKYEVVVLEAFGSEQGLRESEKKWIVAGRAAGTITNGNLGNTLPSVATREKIRATLTGRKQTAEHRKNASIARRGVPQTQEAIASRVAALRISAAFAAHVAKLAETKRGVPRSQEVRDKISISKTGKRFPTEMYAGRAALKRGSTHSPETIEKCKTSWEERRRRFPPNGQPPKRDVKMKINLLREVCA